MSEEGVVTKEPKSLGYALLGVAGVALFLSQGISSIGLGNNADPGAGLFPVGLSIGLGGCGVWLIIRQLMGRGTICGEVSEQQEARPIGRHKRLVGLLLSFRGFLLAIPWLGFSLSALAFSVAAMRCLSVSWKLSAIVSISLVLFVYLLFGLVFHVPLPRGVFGMPF